MFQDKNPPGNAIVGASLSLNDRDLSRYSELQIKYKLQFKMDILEY